MPPSMSPLAYVDVRGLLDRALASPNGIKTTAKSPGAAVHLIFRINSCRKVDRMENRKIYKDEPDHPMFGRSPYDALSVSHKRGECDVYIKVLQEDTIQVEEL